MSSIQERLQLKRVPLDTWNTREKLCLASAVVRSGDQNWMSVSRSLKTIGDPNRPADWYSQKSCAAQYGALLEHVETPKRKKRSSEGAAETPQESILKRLTQERIAEIQETVAEINRQYETLKNEITEARNPNTTEDRLREMWADIEASKRARERESARRAAWLKEREERRARAERTWRPPVQPVTGAVNTPSSPLLTSLLKSSPVVTTPQNITHPANVIETVSPSVGAPTLSMLLESRDSVVPARSASPETKHAAIEHIKSQLVQIERQLKEKSSTPPPALQPAPSVDIDDIEIKAEDVYAFRDIDLHIPPVAAMHKGGSRPVEKDKAVTKQDEPEPMATEPAETAVEVAETAVEETKEEPVPVEPSIDDPVVPEPQPAPDVQPEVSDVVQVQESEPVADAEEVRIGFPTPEIKVIPSEEQPVKVEAEEAPEEVAAVDEEANEEVDVERVEETVGEPQTIVPELPKEEVTPAAEVEDVEPAPVTSVETEDIPLPAETAPEPESNTPSITEPPPEETCHEEKEIKQELIEESKEDKEIEPVSTEQEVAETENPPEPNKVEVEIEEVQKPSPVPEESEEKTVEPEQETPPEPAPKPEPKPEPEVKEEVPAETEEIHETHTETDDDTPMELSREEEKEGKKRRDYSRKRKAESRPCSGSESAEASAPESPGVGSAEASQHRLWKKSVMLVYSRLCAHKYASLFLRPITDDEAPGYSACVKRPMDLSAIRRNIENGTVRTTEEFHRDVLLMLTNALMYNSRQHSVYGMAREMMDEAQSQLSMLLAAQAHAGLEPAPPQRRKRRRGPEQPPAPPPAKRTA